MWELFERISDKIFTDAGICAFILFWMLIYAMLDNRSWRKENRELNSKIFDMGMQQVKISAETNTLLEKLVDTIDAKK